MQISCFSAVLAALLTFVPLGAGAQEHNHGKALPHDIPDFASTPSVRALRTGSWSDQTIWSTGRLPSGGDVVVIPTGTAVTYDVASDAALSVVGINGSLVFRTDRSTRLVVGTMEVFAGGYLEVGRVDAPVAQGVTAEIVIADVAIDASRDPEQYGTGLVGFGKIRMHGASVDPTFVRLAEEPAAGTTSLRIDQQVTGWAPSSRLVLPGTNQPPPTGYQPQWEEPTLAGITDLTLKLGGALRFNHSGARNSDGKLEFLPHVGNLSRNIIVRSANPSGTRGHVIFVERADVDIRYSLFKDLGRTKFTPLDSTTFDAKHVPTHIGANQIGRYSLHMHHLFGPEKAPSSGYQFVLAGNAIDGSTKWGMTIHNSHFGLIKDNVVYDVAGAGIVTEDGSETANVFDHNFVVRTWGTGHDTGNQREGANDWGWEGSGLWFRGPNNFVRNNVVANSNSFAVTYMMLRVDGVPIPTAPGKVPSVPTNMQAVPLREFANNEWYASYFGLTIWDLGAACCTGMFELPVSTLSNTHAWHIGKWGVYGYSSNRVTFDGWVQRNDVRQLSEPTIGFYFGDYIARNTIIRHADIQNVRTAIVVPFKAGDVRDIYGNAPGTFVVEDTNLQAVTGVYLETPWGVTGGGQNLPPRRTTLRNVRFLTPNGNPGDGTPAAIFPAARFDQANPNLVVSDEIRVEAFNGTPGDNFRVYYPEQAPNFIVPQTGNGILAAPVAGLTNEQAWARHHVAIGGAVAPCSAQRPGVLGFACQVTAFESVTESGKVPTAPRDVRLLH